MHFYLFSIRGSLEPGQCVGLVPGLGAVSYPWVVRQGRLEEDSRVFPEASWATE